MLCPDTVLDLQPLEKVSYHSYLRKRIKKEKKEPPKFADEPPKAHFRATTLITRG